MEQPIKLEPQVLHDVWDEILPGLLEIREAWPDMCTWRAEDVYTAIHNREAVVYKVDDGFAVCTLSTDPYSGESDLFIWIAYSPEDKRGGILAKYLPSFIEVAKDLGCRGVATNSSHPALAIFRDMQPVYTRYRVEIDGISRQSGTDTAGTSTSECQRPAVE